MIKKITPKEKSEQRTVSGKHVGVLTSIGAWGVFQGQQLLYVPEKKTSSGSNSEYAFRNALSSHHLCA